VSSAYHVKTEFFPTNSGDLNYQDYLIFYSDSIEFDGIKYKIKEYEVSPFESKDDLLRYFACHHDFPNSSENISGGFISYAMDEEIPRIGDDIQFIYFNDCGQVEHYVYVDDGLYRFFNNPIFTEENVVHLVLTEEEEEIVKFAHNADTNALVYFVEEPEFEIITEQVLVKDTYTILEEKPNEYVQEFATIYSELSNCENAIFDTIYEQILVKEGGIRFDIFPAVLETVTEQSLVQNKYEGEGFYERIPQDSMVISQRSSHIKMNGFDIAAGCSRFDFYGCVNFDFETVPSKDTIVYSVFEKCADGFTSAGKYCYSNSGEVPWVFEYREYEKLVIPTTATQVELPNEYGTVASVRIVNKHELDSECIEVRYDSIPYQKLIMPATTIATTVPSEYGTRIFKNYENGGIIAVEGGEEDTYFEIATLRGGSIELQESSGDVLTADGACNFEAIKQRLVEVGYLNENEFENLRAVHLAALNYQLDNDLPIGVFNEEFIELLEVKFGF